MRYLHSAVTQPCTAVGCGWGDGGWNESQKTDERDLLGNLKQLPARLRMILNNKPSRTNSAYWLFSSKDRIGNTYTIGCSIILGAHTLIVLSWPFPFTPLILAALHLITKLWIHPDY